MLLTAERVNCNFESACVAKRYPSIQH